MKIFVAQVKPRIGDIRYNFDIIYQSYKQAAIEGANLCLLPELVTTGYIPEDLLFKPVFIDELNIYIKELIGKIGETTLLLPSAYKANGELYNGVLAIQNSQIIGKTAKVYLPNYSIFDEKRYFTTGESQVITVNNIKIGIPICEDIWSSDIPTKLKEQGAECLLVPNASPLEQDKYQKRLDIVAKRYNEIKIPIIYCNQVSGQDGIIFDGRSFGYDGEEKFVLAIYKPDSLMITINNKKIETQHKSIILNSEDEIYGAIVFGLREYLDNNNFKTVSLGLSGGIDSALVAAIAADAIGAENVYAFMLPSKFTSQQSFDDAADIASKLKINYEIINIQSIIDVANNALGDTYDTTYENLQSRVRGMMLMANSNMKNSLLLTTGNKSENATGYATLYGDMCGGFNPIKDLYKTQVVRLAKFRNCNLPKSIEILNNNYPVMSENVIVKPPSAELRDNQKDSDTLPEYEILDKILTLYIEEDLGIEEIVDKGFSQQTVIKIAQLVRSAEFKRKQSVVGVKVTKRDLSKDRRYPITNSYY